jgi:hypothetical protein
MFGGRGDTMNFAAAAIADCQDKHTDEWHKGPYPEIHSPDLQQIINQHCVNFSMWHIVETDTTEKEGTPLTSADKLLELRKQHDQLIRLIDERILQTLPETSDVPMNSETPGNIIDRLSFLSLQIYHTENIDQKVRLIKQRLDLIRCLQELIDDLHAGRKKLRLY